eukprot:110305-Hanusia_phi.AAC.1
MGSKSMFVERPLDPIFVDLLRRAGKKQDQLQSACRHIKEVILFYNLQGMLSGLNIQSREKMDPKIRFSIEEYERMVAPLGKTKLDFLSSEEFLVAVKEEFLDFCQRHLDKAIPIVHKNDPQLSLTMAAIRMLLSDKEQRKTMLNLEGTLHEQREMIVSLQQEMAQMKKTFRHAIELFGRDGNGGCVDETESPRSPQLCIHVAAD